MIDLPENRGSKLGRVGNKILAGFLLIVPIVMTLWITAFLYDLLTDWAAWILEFKLFAPVRDIFGFETIVRLFSLILVLAVLFGIGTVAKYAIGKRILTILEQGILKIPMLSIVYSTAQQIIDALRNPNAGMFRKVVLFEYPRKGLYVIGFLTNENNDNWEIDRKVGRDLISIFLPTTPNPTSGFLLFVPREDCIFLEMGIAEGMRLVISGGAVAPHGEHVAVEEGGIAALPTEQSLENHEGTSNIQQ
jgi:uncharacterized membrane protein